MGKPIGCPRCGELVDSNKISQHRCRARNPEPKQKVWEKSKPEQRAMSLVRPRMLLNRVSILTRTDTPIDRMERNIARVRKRIEEESLR